MLRLCTAHRFRVQTHQVAPSIWKAPLYVRLYFGAGVSRRTKRVDNQVAPECGLHHPGITSAPLWSSARTNRADGNVGQHREESVCEQGGRPVLGRLRHPKTQNGPVLAVLSVAMGLVGRFGAESSTRDLKSEEQSLDRPNMHAG